jgi:phage shock protein C
MVEGKRLYRSRTDRKVAGVCGGIGRYFGVDPVVFRIVWVLLILGMGAGLLAYLICWLIIPLEPETAASESPTP